MNGLTKEQYIEDISKKLENYTDAEKAYIQGVVDGIKLDKDTQEHNKAS